MYFQWDTFGQVEDTMFIVYKYQYTVQHSSPNNSNKQTDIL